MAGIWSYDTKVAPEGIFRRFGPFLGRLARPLGRRALLAGIVLAVALVGGFPIGDEARGAKGVVRARARVVHRCAPEALELARSDFRDRHHAEILAAQSGEIGGGGAGIGNSTQSRDFEGGRFRLTLEGEVQRRQLTIEFLAN